MFDEENVKPEKLTKAPENAGIDPSTMRVSKWYQGPTREDDDPPFPSSNRVSDIFTGVDRASYQAQEPIENDEDKLAMKRGVICLRHCQSELPSREFEKIKHYRNSFELGQDAPCYTLSHKHGLIEADVSSRDLWEKQVQTLNFSTCQRTRVAFSSTMWVPSTGRVNSGDQRT